MSKRTKRLAKQLGGGSGLGALVAVAVAVLLLVGGVVKTIRAGLVQTPLVVIALVVLVAAVLIVATMIVGALLRLPGFSYRLRRGELPVPVRDPVATLAREAALPAAVPLEPAAPYVVDLEREAVPVDLDALERH